VNVSKCAKYFLNLKRCRPGDGQAQMVLPVLLFRKFEEEGLCTVSYVAVVKGAGRLSVPEVLSAVTSNTCLIRYMCTVSYVPVNGTRMVPIRIIESET
jgi:hypothetical protein